MLILGSEKICTVMQVLRVKVTQLLDKEACMLTVKNGTQDIIKYANTCNERYIHTPHYKQRYSYIYIYIYYEH